MAANTDKLRKGFYGSATTISANISNTNATIPLSSTVGLPTDTAIDIVIDRVDANGNKTPSKQETTTVVISGTNATAAVRGVEGLAQAHSSGAVVEILYTAATHNDHVNWGLAQHKQDGSHGAVTADSLSVAGTSSTDFPSHFANFLSDGGVWTLSSGLNGTSTAGHVYYIGQRYSIPAVASNAFTASNDTYVDVNPTSGAFTYVPVANGTVEPAVTAASVRVAKVVTSASTITSIDQNLYNKPINASTLAESVGLVPWKSWTPTFTNFTLGNGTINYAKSIKIGNTVHFRAKVTLGNTSSMGSNPTISLPEQANADYATGADPTCFTNARVNNVTYFGPAEVASSSALSLLSYSTSNSYISHAGWTASIPNSWTSGNTFTVWGSYEAA